MSSQRDRSTRKGSQKNMSLMELNTEPRNQPIILTLIIVMYHLLVLGYLITLENAKCNCIMDWRHNFLKYYSIIMIFVSLFILIIYNNRINMSVGMQIIQVCLMVAFLINIWCLYTYIGDLDKTNCKCAIEDQKDIHYFLYIWRYILVATVIVALISILLAIIFSKS